MSRLEILGEMLKELKLYKEYLLNIKILSELKNENSSKVLIKK